MLTFLLAVLSTVHVASAHAPFSELPHLDPQMTGAELQSILDQRRKSLSIYVNADDPLNAILKIGKRNIDWITFINQSRPADKKLLLSSAQTQIGYPIDKPAVSNREIILSNLEALKAELPAAMSDVLFSDGSFPADIALDDEKFLVLARRVDRMYSSASRWLLQEMYLGQYEGLAWKDIRGYYGLSREEGLQDKLKAWNSLDSVTQDRLGEWLIGQCLNAQSNSKAGCRDEFKQSLDTSKSATEFFKRYYEIAHQVYDDYFFIQNARSDVDWTNPNVFSLPFLKPETSEVQNFLLNIEDEWHWENWQLKLAFQDNWSGAHVTFSPGVTPHVNGLGGNEITMDSNRPLDDYTARWTIRHEFGHVLGFPDCYTEFYDSEKQVMINYQLDTANLMCSRQGKFQARHLKELQRAYLHQPSPMPFSLSSFMPF